MNNDKQNSFLNSSQYYRLVQDPMRNRLVTFWVINTKYEKLINEIKVWKNT